MRGVISGCYMNFTYLNLSTTSVSTVRFEIVGKYGNIKLFKEFKTCILKIQVLSTN